MKSGPGVPNTDAGRELRDSELKNKKKLAIPAAVDPQFLAPPHPRDRYDGKGSRLKKVYVATLPEKYGGKARCLGGHHRFYLAILHSVHNAFSTKAL
jgi:hypothetical protein